MPNFLDLMNLEGEILTGATMADAPALEAVGWRTNKPHCAVYSWVLIDVLGAQTTLTAPVRNATPLRFEDGLPSDAKPSSPLVLYSHYVAFHSTNGFQKGDAVRSAYATAFDGRSIFETEDTIFILMGKGFRRSATVEEVESIPVGVVDEIWLENRPTKPRGGIARWADEEMVFCDIKMTPAQSQLFSDLIRQWRESGDHPELESVFRDIEQELS
jgi:hypothetical protein